MTIQKEDSQASEEVYERCRRISWATPNKETALKYVKKAKEENDSYALKLLKHYNIA